MWLCESCGQENPEASKFCGNCGTPLAPPVPTREMRKVVTIVFCDLTGSTQLGDRTDPETLRATMRGYYDEMRTILERHGGTVEKFVGDAVMAVFGVPVSHEDDALRAVRAAWQMRSAVPVLGLQARIGVNTGEVMAGDGDTLVTGDAVNVAARLEQAAGPGEVLIGDETRRLVRDAVQVDRVDVAAKGKPDPIAAFRLLDVDPEAAAISRRLDTPLVGRAGELDQLRQAFDRTVRERRCHLFTLLGPAGVGKSRLVAEFIGGLDARIVEGRCLDYGEGITFWPVISVIKQLGERAEETLSKVVEGGTLPNEVPWAVRSLFEEIAGEHPLVIVFDDIHWGEETFLDLVDHIADMSRGAPILLLCVARPELLDKRPGWGGGKLNASTILLEPLSANECSELIAMHGGVDAATRARILAAADGNPLFVEEMVAYSHESDDVSIPSSVQALLQARIDQLGGDERAVIERGAVEGEIFHRGAVTELSLPADVDPQLVGLVRKELIRPERALLAGDQAFRFRHLLIRDAAYNLLPKEMRAELHERFADWLVIHGTVLIELDEVVGYHIEQAAGYHRELGHARSDLEERAGERLAAAGRRAAERGDGPAALKLLRRASGMLREGTSPWERTELDRLALLIRSTREEELVCVTQELERQGPRLAMHARLAQLEREILQAPAGAVERAKQAIDEATILFEEHGDERGLSSVCDLRAATCWLESQARKTLAATDEGARHAARGNALTFPGRTDVMRIGPLVHGPFTAAETRRRAEELPEDSHARIVLGAHLSQLAGDYERSLETAEALIEQLSQLGLPPLVAPPMTARADALYLAGRLDDADRAYEEALKLFKELGLASFRSTMLIAHGEVRYAMGDHESAEALALRGEALGLPEDIINFARGRTLRGCVAADRGDVSTGEELARSGLENAYATDFPRARAEAHVALAHVLRVAGRAEEARTEIESAIEIWETYDYVDRARRTRKLLVEL